MFQLLTLPAHCVGKSFHDGRVFIQLLFLRIGLRIKSDTTALVS